MVGEMGSRCYFRGGIYYEGMRGACMWHGFERALYVGHGTGKVLIFMIPRHAFLGYGMASIVEEKNGGTKLNVSREFPAVL